LFWTLLAGALLEPEDRYIGIMLTALAIVVIYLYIYTNLNFSRTIKVESILLINRTEYSKI